MPTPDTEIQKEYHAMMNDMAHALDSFFNGINAGKEGERETGFVLLVFPFGELAPGGEKRTNYISNGASRQDIVVLMKELITRFEGQAEPKTGHA